MVIEEPQPYQYQAWPAWFYGPNGESEIFNAKEEVPPGWSDTPGGAPVEPAKRGPGRPAKVDQPAEDQF